MGNLMTSMYTGVTGLSVSQSALNTTAHNLANVNTDGYVRQQSIMTDLPYNTYGASYHNTMQIGLGTTMAMISQVRETFLDKSYRSEIGRQGFYEAQSEAVDEVESVFGELQGESFQDVVSDLWSNLQELTKEPGDITKRTLLVQSATNFVERASAISKQLSDYQVNLNTEITTKVNRINQIGDRIHDLNKTIQQYESNGQQANDYRDERNLLMDELGGLTKYSYTENSSGVVNINVEGIQFVTETNVIHMGTASLTTDSNLLKPVWPTNNNMDVYQLNAPYSAENKSDMGSLKGLLVTRGTKAARYTDIPQESDYSNPLDYKAAVDNYNNTVDSSVIMATQAQFDQLVHGVVTMINDALSPNVSVSQYSTNMKLSTPTAFVKYPDGSNHAVTSDMMLWDQANAPIGEDVNKTPREALFDRKNTDRYTKVDLIAADGTTKIGEAYLYNKEDSTDNYSLFTLGEIEVNGNIKKDSSLLPLTSNSTSGESGAYNSKLLSDLTSKWQKKFAAVDPNTATKNNIDDYYTAMIADLANRGKVLDSQASNQKSMVESIDNKRQQVAGVSSDEELTNMVKFQHAYNASSRYINAINEMLENLITKLG